MNGGRRLGAGRKHGSQNIVSQNLRERILAEGISPLRFLANLMRDPEQPLDLRVDVAKSILGYIHPKLQSVEHITPGDEAETPKTIELVFVRPEPTPLNTQPPLPQLSVGHQVHQEIEDHTFVPNLF
jgi:hypothetical protein